ncbi:MAG: hypothetical protein ABIB61_03155 [Candidatus Shapirobacteria bacterium]
MNRRVMGFPRTIYDFGERSPGFLDPWTSLQPGYLREKIAPEIMGVFSNTAGGLKFYPYFKVKKDFVDPAQINDKWALVFPKRTYLPPNYPHFQLWLLGQDYIPSPKFMSDSEANILGQLIAIFTSALKAYAKKNRLKGKVAFGYNSTPFSFIKDKLGRYYAGGQSVRAFHLHCLLIPKPKKMLIPKNELFLIHPTTFSHKLLCLIFKNQKILKKLGAGGAKNIYKTIRGVKISSFSSRPASLQNLWQTVEKIDKLLYDVQSLLVLSFYKDADKFIRKIEKVVKSKDINKVKGVLEDLVVVGQERKLEVLKKRLREGLVKLGKRYGADFKPQDLKALIDCLCLDEKGDLASMVFDQKVVLRPGLGYALLVENNSQNRFSLKIQPLDVLGSKGLIESSGYWFEKKIIKKEFPNWAVDVTQDLISRFR